ncbi:NADH dehydrogenase subunit N [Melghiribacillus thermohalophilus]|uniref:NADH-quinone oxidoreductase subunit N n=1 Tax=Melghiribacillus thermohalophilus TaxID=1324956 RepID=A0A4R3NGK1_9BACI|nr:NADH-quinone oxidoreductase subunit NuoN [Melghiribacillus thermohalophilus]TCT26423.1 NADH dehydrogenase subunit N [Melghiribacillus thermohalophilus]
MDLETLLSFKWSIMAPEFTILITGVIVSLQDLFYGNKRLSSWLSILGVLLAIAFLSTQYQHESVSILYDTYIFDEVTFFFKIILLTGTLLILLMTSPSWDEETERVRGDFHYLLLAALLGGMIVVSSGDVITLYAGLELLSISSYIMVGIRKYNRNANEGAMKYIITGSLASAVTLFGLSYIYGLTGTTNLFDISREMSAIDTQLEPLAILGFVITFVGLTFKISTVPFHMWTPDVYQGASTPVAAFLSVVSKAAGFILIARMLIIAFTAEPGLEQGTVYEYGVGLIAVLAALTMIVGNTVALRQRNMKRLFAYSSIAHAGYLLIPLAALTSFSLETIWFYLLAYMLMNIGAFAVLHVLIQNHANEDMSIFSGLYHRSPVLTVMMTIFLASLAGIPGTAGFIGKFNIFLGALSADPARYVLAGIMVATTVISYVYYFNILVQMYSRPAEKHANLQVPAITWVTVGFCTLGTVLFGIFPNLPLQFFNW